MKTKLKVLINSISLVLSQLNISEKKKIIKLITTCNEKK